MDGMKRVEGQLEGFWGVTKKIGNDVVISDSEDLEQMTQVSTEKRAGTTSSHEQCSAS